MLEDVCTSVALRSGGPFLILDMYTPLWQRAHTQDGRAIHGIQTVITYARSGAQVRARLRLLAPCASGGWARAESAAGSVKRTAGATERLCVVEA